MPLDIDMSESIWAIQAREQGVNRGIEQGLKQGEGELFLRLLEHRFGALPTSVGSRVNQASRQQIEQWAFRIYSAHSLEEVFED